MVYRIAVHRYFLFATVVQENVLTFLKSFVSTLMSYVGMIILVKGTNLKLQVIDCLSLLRCYGSLNLNLNIIDSTNCSYRQSERLVLHVTTYTIS